MIEKVIIAAYEYMNNLPPVKQRSQTGWWPHYDKEYKDEPVEYHGSLEAYEWLISLPLITSYRKLLYSFYGTGYKVSEDKAKKVYSQANVDDLNELLNHLEQTHSHKIKWIAQLFTP